jgi:hypothetical protein
LVETDLLLQKLLVRQLQVVGLDRVECVLLGHHRVGQRVRALAEILVLRFNVELQNV